MRGIPGTITDPNLNLRPSQRVEPRPGQVWTGEQWADPHTAEVEYDVERELSPGTKSTRRVTAEKLLAGDKLLRIVR